jgi:very-short-patch-repair endonuclease
MDNRTIKRGKSARPRSATALSRRLRRSETDAERRIWLSLRNRRLGGFKFRRQQAFGPYIVDFFCAEQFLIVELDGGQHAVNAEQDTVRTSYLVVRGYRVLRFWNNDVLSNTPGVLESILKELRTPYCSPSLIGDSTPVSFPPEGED